MSHHFDSPTAIEDGRINLCDVYAFDDGPSHSCLVLTVNPDASRSTPTTLRPDALYEFVVATDAGTVADRAWRMTFGEPEADGRQHMTIRYADGMASRSAVDGTLLGEGDTGDAIPLAGGGTAWFGVVADPFWADGAALAGFLQALAAGAYRPEVLTVPPSNLFDGRNVTAVALQLPNTAFGADHVTLWARISLYGHAPQRRVSRMGNPMLRPLFFPVPGADTDAANAAGPDTDVALHTERLRQAATRLANLRGLPEPDRHAARVVEAFLPDVLHFRPGRPALFRPGAGNGRALHDDAFGTALSLFNDGALGVSSSPHPVVGDFPHLGPAGARDLPALAELFGLREHDPEGRVN
jgi:hypothetical protein